MSRPGPGVPQAAGGDRGEESYPPSLETDMSVIFPRPVPFATGPRSSGLKTDADVIFRGMAGSRYNRAHPGPKLTPPSYSGASPGPGITALGRDQN